MVWFKVCDTLHSHLKAHAAGLEAMGLWTLCGSWCGQQLTDGFVPSFVVNMYGTDDLALRLVDAGLWDVVPGGGYRFHDWHENNPMRADVETRRESWKQKKRQQRGRYDDSSTVSLGESMRESLGVSPVDSKGESRESPGRDGKGLSTTYPVPDSPEDSLGESPGDTCPDGDPRGPKSCALCRARAKQQREAS